MQSLVDAIAENIECSQKLSSLEPEIIAASKAIKQTFDNGNRLFVCGNGGSAADAQHFASELTGRFEKTRPGFPAFALTNDTSAMTAIANDFGYESIFARQLMSLGSKGDLLLVISTSGNSANLIEAVRQAKEQGLTCIGLLGREGGELVSQVDISVVVSGARTSRIQESHIFILHYFCEIFEPQDG